MSYEKPSMVGKFNQYKASPANKLSVDLLRKAEGSVPLFIPINIGFNAVHSNILKNINIKTETLSFSCGNSHYKIVTMEIGATSIVSLRLFRY